MYFVTFTVHQLVDVFIGKQYIDILIDSLQFCQNEKGLKTFAWVSMTNHIHLKVKSDENKLSNIIRDFKKYTSTKMVNVIVENKKVQRTTFIYSSTCRKAEHVEQPRGLKL